MRAHLCSAAIAASISLLSPTQGQPVSGPPLDPAITATSYWHLDDVCRGESDPAIYEPACLSRDRALKRLGATTIQQFHDAWVRGDQRTIRRIVKNDAYLPYFRGRSSNTSPDCTYNSAEPSFYCWVKPRTRDWVGVSFEVTRHERPLLPLWQITGAAPDV